MRYRWFFKTFWDRLGWFQGGPWPMIQLQSGARVPPTWRETWSLALWRFKTLK